MEKNGFGSPHGPLSSRRRRVVRQEWDRLTRDRHQRFEKKR